MKTPICDFVENYTQKNAVRLHMPGHKGKAFLGVEKGDITEIDGADSLYDASGIIGESEKNASSLFGVPTFYSTEGSSHCIRAMLLLCKAFAKISGAKNLVWAARNAHKVLVSACALNNLEIEWLYGKDEKSVLSCTIDAKELDRKLSSAKVKPVAVYVTSPDYLGNIADINGISKVCHRHNVILCVDSAHGAYMKFLKISKHPSDLGADMVCASAHKTLPVLTGGAYLHLSGALPEHIIQKAKSALSFFGSTSPSYLTLASLDKANSYLADSYAKKLDNFCEKVTELKCELIKKGYTFLGDEELKLTIDAKAYGYTGFEVASYLKSKNIVCEFYDPDFLVLMLSPELESENMALLCDALCNLPQKEPIEKKLFSLSRAKRKMSVLDAIMSETEEVDTEKAAHRVYAKDNIACPPAVPLVVCGEEISDEAVEIMKYYGIKKCTVVK